MKERVKPSKSSISRRSFLGKSLAVGAGTMTGWRMGYGVMPADLATHVSRLMTNSNSCTASFTQIAGVEALCGSQDVVDEMRAKFKKRRDVMVAGLNKIKGFSCRVPHGAQAPARARRPGLLRQHALPNA